MTVTAQLADGRTLEFPDGTAPDVVQSAVKRVLFQGVKDSQASKERTRAMIDADPISRGARAFPTEGDTVSAGMGKAFTDIGRGAAQMVGQGPSAEEMQETRKLDAPLMRSAGGRLGNVAGNIAAVAPLAVAPGAATVGGAGAIGALTGALQPTTGTGERLTNMAIGGGLGAGSQFAGTTGAQMLGERAVKRQNLADTLRRQNTVRDETLRRGQEAGYVVPPSAVNPSFLNKRLESVAGKAAVGQEAAGRNQQITNALARKALGLADDVPITEGVLRGVRQEAGKAYKDVAALAPRAESALEILKDARHEAQVFRRHYDVSADPNSLRSAKHFADKAEQLERVIESTAAKSGKPQLVDALKKARTQIAKSYDVERALNIGTGDVSAPVLGRALDKGRPLTGELETIGRFAEGFAPYAREGAKIPTPGVSKSEALAGALFGLGGSMATGSPVGAAAALLPLASGPVRSGVLSGPYQRLMAQPNYAPSLGTDALATLANPKTREQLAMALRMIAAPSAMGSQSQ